MSRYTLKTLCRDEVIERFDHRPANALYRILDHPRHHRVGQVGPWGEIEKHPDRFEIFDSIMEKIFDGNIQDAMDFVRTLK